MKKYTKPMVNVVSLKSSEDIAASFKAIRKQFTDSYLYKIEDTEYAVSQYSTLSSTVDSTDA